MSLNHAQRDSLKATAARDQAETLLAKMEEAFANAQTEAEERTDIPPEQLVAGKQAIERALESTRHMVESLSEAVRLADEAASKGGWVEGVDEA